MISRPYSSRARARRARRQAVRGSRPGRRFSG